MTAISVWIQAARPKTLWAAVVPVLIGSTIAYADGLFHYLSAAAALAGALAIQIGTNFTNDYSDFAKGADTKDRKGPTRVTQAGLLPPQAVKRAAALTFAIASLVGVYLIARGGWPVLAIGVSSILAGIFYTAGPKPLGYMGLGDFFVLVFFGPVAVAGTYYVQTLTVNWIVVTAGLAPGFLSVALLAINNLRDIDEDRIARKRTLAVRFGRGFARSQYIGCIVAASLVPVFLVLATGERIWTLACLLILPVAAPEFRRLMQGTAGEALNPMLASTARLSIIFSLLFALTWIL